MDIVFNCFLLQARDPSISGNSFTKMMDFMPMLEETKLEMYIEMTACTMPIFKVSYSRIRALELSKKFYDNTILTKFIS